MPAVGDQWLSVREAADLAGVTPQRMRRRVIALHRARPEIGLVRRPGKRWLEVSAEGLQRALSTTDPNVNESEVDALAAANRTLTIRVDDLLRRVRALEQWKRRHMEQMHATSPSLRNATTRQQSLDVAS